MMVDTSAIGAAVSSVRREHLPPVDHALLVLGISEVAAALVLNAYVGYIRLVEAAISFVPDGCQRPCRWQRRVH